MKPLPTVWRAAVFIATACALRWSNLAAQQVAGDPKDGREVLERMHAAYAGRWYSSLAFVQRTIMVRPDGVRDTATWYESLKGPALLRIDLGDPTDGRGVVFTADSTYRFQESGLTGATNEGNPFLPLIMGVYLQPVDVTAGEIAHHGVDLSRAHLGRWQGKTAYVVGTAVEADSTTPQFWVDADRLLLVRMILSRAPNGPPADIRLDDYVQVDGGWLGTKVTFLFGGSLRQLEEYTEWSTQASIPDALFDRARWTTEGHWATMPRVAPAWQRHRPSR